MLSQWRRYVIIPLYSFSNHQSAQRTPPLLLFFQLIESSIVKSPLTGSGASAVWGAAAGDLSKHVGKGLCTPWSSSDPMSAKNCSGTTNIGGYQGPNCPTSKYCGTPTCYRVTNIGAFNHGTFASGGGISTGQSITVKIIDVCPAYHAQNYCAILSDKSLANLEQHCESSSTDSLDIDTNAYAALTGKKGSRQHVNVSLYTF